MATGDRRSRRSAAEHEVVARCKRAMLARSLSDTAADVGRRLDMEPATVRKLFNGSRHLTPEFVRDLGQLAGEPVAELHRMLGWIPAAEVLPVTARAGRHDVLLGVPDPAGDLPAHDPAVPDEVMDSSARVAWTVAGALPGPSGGCPLSRLRPGLLSGWHSALSADPDARISRLTDLRKA